MKATKTRVRALGCASLVGGLFLAQQALAVTFVVNSTADAPDAVRGDGVCATAAGACTLRAAVDETNALPGGTDFITLPAGTYALTSRESLRIYQGLQITGAAAATTVLDGGDQSGLVEVRSVETLVIDAGLDRIASLRTDGSFAEDFISTGSGGLDLPQRIRLASYGMNQDVLVSTLSNGVLRYSRETGAFVSQIIPASIGGQPFVAGDIVPGPLGNPINNDLFAANFLPGGSILRFNASTGALIGTFVAGTGLAQPTAMVWTSIGGADALLVAIVNEDRILRYDTAGNLVGVFASGISSPRDLAVRNNVLYVAAEGADSVLRYDLATGAALTPIVPAGSGGLDAPQSIAISPTGDLLVSSTGNQRILQYDAATGRFIRIYAQASGTLLLPGAFTILQQRDNGPVVTLRNVTLANGRTAQTGGPSSGLTTDAGTSTALYDSVVRDCDSSVFGGGIQNWGTLDLIRVSVTGNAMPPGGGGVTSTGGGIFSAGRLTVRDSLIADNFATRGGGINVVNSGSSAQIVNSTISGNHALGGGGGLRVTANARASISFSTITDNTAAESPGADPDDNGGGIFVGSGGVVDLGNTIVAENSDGRSTFDADYSPDCYAPTAFSAVSSRDNIIGELTDNCQLRDVIFGNTSGIIFGNAGSPIDPGLLPLADNGGPTLTHALDPSSLAVDADDAVTSSTFFDCPSADQRQIARPQDGDGDGTLSCDLGAVELGISANAGPDQTIECSASGRGTTTLAATDQSGASYAWSAPADVTLQTPNQRSTSASFPLGSRSATVQVSRGATSVSDSVQVTVVDTTPPTLNVPADVVAAACGAVSIGQATGSDSCGGNVTITNDAPATYRAGVTTVTWRAVDARGNPTTRTQRVTVPLGNSSNCCPVGSNVITGTPNNDTLTGTAGVDCILGLGGQDTIRGLGGNDFLSGGEGEDTIEAGAGNDFVQGGAGQDILRGEDGDDTLLGQDGDDQCFGGNGNDAISGGQGQDRLFGDAGDDQLSGEAGDDRLEGAAGNDNLNGGANNDTCIGGAGTNTVSACEF